MLKVRIQGQGSDTAQLEDGGVLTSILPYPPLNVENKVIPFVGNLTLNGDGVTSSLSVDGSTINVDAFIGPPVFGDLYLTSANILIGDSGVLKLNTFGSIAGGLTNGVDFFIENANQRVVFASALKTNFDFIRVGTLTQGLGGKNDAYQMSNATPANEDAYNPIIDFTLISPGGVRLRKDTLDKLGIIIKDDITSVSLFNILINGYIRI